MIQATLEHMARNSKKFKVVGSENNLQHNLKVWHEADEEPEIGKESIKQWKSFEPNKNLKLYTGLCIHSDASHRHLKQVLKKTNTSCSNEVPQNSRGCHK